MTRADIAPCAYIALLAFALAGCAKKKVAPDVPPPIQKVDPYKDDCFGRIATGWNPPPDAKCQAKTFR